MKMHMLAAAALAAVMAGTTVTAMAEYVQPKAYVTTHTVESEGVWATTSQRLFLNAGPGTRRFFRELGSFGSSAGERVRILAKAWDPNNSIWWVKVEYPDGSGNTGWTGVKRFVASSFSLSAVPAEDWYE